MCIRGDAGSCCVEYSACSDEDDAFSLQGNDNAVTPDLSKVEDVCVVGQADHVGIEGKAAPTCTRWKNDRFAVYYSYLTHRCQCPMFSPRFTAGCAI